MAKAKNPRTPSPRSKKNGVETAAAPLTTAVVQAGVPESVVLSSVTGAAELLPSEVATTPVKTEARPVAVKSESARKPLTDARRTIVPINLEEEIRRRAYQLYEERGCTPGHENDDWLVAEREVLMRYSAQQHSA